MGWIQAYRRERESHNKILRGSTIAFLIIFEHKKNSIFNYVQLLKN